jgi:hypothetical protein
MLHATPLYEVLHRSYEVVGSGSTAKPRQAARTPNTNSGATFAIRDALLKRASGTRLSA